MGFHHWKWFILTFEIKTYPIWLLVVTNIPFVLQCLLRHDESTWSIMVANIAWISDAVFICYISFPIQGSNTLNKKTKKITTTQAGRFWKSGEHFVNGYSKIIFRIDVDMAQESFHFLKVTKNTFNIKKNHTSLKYIGKSPYKY